MSDYVWQPVENQEDAIAAAMQHILRWDKLPADAALCRRVPAPAQGVPVEVRERLAAVAHEIWAHWMHYLFSKCEQNPDGSVTIPVGLVLRWGRQIDTPYNELSEQERESDRHQADKIMAAWLDAQPQTGQE